MHGLRGSLERHREAIVLVFVVMDVLEAIWTRRSVRVFLPDPVPGGTSNGSSTRRGMPRAPGTANRCVGQRVDRGETQGKNAAPNPRREGLRGAGACVRLRRHGPAFRLRVPRRRARGSEPASRRVRTWLRELLSDEPLPRPEDLVNSSSSTSGYRRATSSSAPCRSGR